MTILNIPIGCTMRSKGINLSFVYYQTLFLRGGSKLTFTKRLFKNMF